MMEVLRKASIPLDRIVGGGRSFTQDEYAKVLELIAASAKASYSHYLH
jgi:hypothetical protein